MGRRLDGLMALSQAGSIKPSEEELSFAELASEAVDLVAGRLKEREIDVVIHQDLPTVHGDRERLVQVLQNLVDNAAKYMGSQAAPRIEIGANKSEIEKVFYVRDNGSGIALEDQRTIFDIFTRMSRDTEGTGIGLAHVQRVIEAHGGRIWVESEGSGKGSIFCFTLPP